MSVASNAIVTYLNLDNEAPRIHFRGVDFVGGEAAELPVADHLGLLHKAVGNPNFDVMLDGDLPPLAPLRSPLAIGADEQEAEEDHHYRKMARIRRQRRSAAAEPA